MPLVPRTCVRVLANFGDVFNCDVTLPAMYLYILECPGVLVTVDIFCMIAVTKWARIGEMIFPE